MNNALAGLIEARSDLGLPTITTTNLDEDALRNYLHDSTTSLEDRERFLRDATELL